MSIIFILFTGIFFKNGDKITLQILHLFTFI